MPRPPVFEVPPTATPRARLDILYEELIIPGSRDPGMIALSRSVISDGIQSGLVGRNDPVGHQQLLLDWQYRNVPYAEDPIGPDGYEIELFKWAWKAIEDREDDCEGKITVFCTMAMAVGYPAFPVWIEQPLSRNNHVAGKVAVPRWAAASLPVVKPYEVVIVLPSRVPEIDGVWAWVEATLPAVKLSENVVIPGAQIGEFPYDVQNRLRDAGVTRRRL